MLEGLGVTLQPLVSTGNVITWALIIGAGLTWWIRGIPDRKRAENEEKVIDNTEAARADSLTRAEFHRLRNDVSKCLAEQRVGNKKVLDLEKELARREVISTARTHQIENLLQLGELLTAEVERIDQHSIIVPQAKMILKQAREVSERAEVVAATRADSDDSKALAVAKGAVADAKQTLVSTQDTCDEVKQAEGNGK